MKIILLFCICSISFAQEITGKELLEKAIQYHDPDNNWSRFNGTLLVTMETPNSSHRYSRIQINLPEAYFNVKASKDSKTTEYTLDKQKCSIALNGKSNLTDAELKTNNLSCERANLYKNYYTYLYGLPMKLKDPGTLINPKVEKKTFKGQDYLVLNVSYEDNIGTDIWYFYFNPETYALEVYQFYKTDDDGSLKKDSGEYILLSDVEIINNIKIPKIRKWYYNKDNGYLGTDILKQ
ncbi:DUF6503 family protein [Ichthyenterobacterium sp. W332]|uniref:DUF6503 family protein n=1 Tax=Microcosmobacter mediterraneus TaxID=3075607 RepID=A0ABU2YJB7_9FLAO|nr:DUF6503 family protein [Ichthyenterobacterium sp. W332]MDT0558132.1 DUF6503 family protein [Ichthyenterobacterium sp. W332]